MAATESNWPGGWEPSLRDVDLAHELPAPTELSNFKKALLASSDAHGAQKLMHIKLDSRDPEQQYTYPMSLLSSFPLIPDEGERSRLRQEFGPRCQTHLFLARVPVQSTSSDAIAPSLGLGMACLAAVSEQGQCPFQARGDKANRVYIAGIRLWTVMLEVDNREARSFETVAAAALLLMYGSLHPDEQILKQSNLMLAQTATICRRQRLQDPAQIDGRLGATSSNPLRAYSPLVCLLWLNDTLSALHLTFPRSFRTSEMWIKMPASAYDFQAIYRALIQEQDLPKDLKAPEDGMLLLVAILSDLVTTQCTLGSVANRVQPKATGNPYAALSPRTELDRLQNLHSNSLDKWREQFEALLGTRPEIAAFYHFCRLYLACPWISGLSHLAGYRSPVADLSRLGNIPISTEATRSAWFVLDTAASRPKNNGSLCPVWLPVIIFQAGLVIGARLNSLTEQDTMYNSPRALTAFKVELENMPWPCCEEMASTLERLMSITA